jgi:hypothetical protein
MKRQLSAFLIVMSFATFASATEAINAKYKQIGAATLGKPAGSEKAASGGGRVRLYANGGIWWSKTTGVHAVYGPTYTRYKSLRAERGKLGYPVTDVRPMPDGSAQTLFRHGYILIGASGTVTAEAMPEATYTEDSVTLKKGMKVAMKSPTEALIEKLPQVPSGGATYSCDCLKPDNTVGTGKCDITTTGNVIRCAGAGCKNSCRLSLISGGGR